MSISKREKIIVVLAVLAALYAGGQLLFSGNSADRLPSTAEDKPAEAFLMEVAQSLAQHQLSETEKAVLEKTEAPWPASPFIRTGTSSSTGTAETSSLSPGMIPGNFAYTGYIEAGNRRLAIVGGAEYETGDRVADSPLTIRGILPDQVLLEDAEGRKYSAPLQDGSGRNSALILLQSE